MESNLDSAKQFFEACETGKGWKACQEYCHDGATFSAQADALADITELENYVEWMKGFFTPVPDGKYELKFFGEDTARSTVAAVAVFQGTQSGPGGPSEPTGKTVAADYVYNIKFDGDKIKHMTKIWNDGHSLKQLGWT